MEKLSAIMEQKILIPPYVRPDRSSQRENVVGWLQDYYSWAYPLPILPVRFAIVALVFFGVNE